MLSQLISRSKEERDIGVTYQKRTAFCLYPQDLYRHPKASDVPYAYRIHNDTPSRWQTSMA